MNQKGPKTLTTFDCNTLMAQQFEPLQFYVEKFLPHSLFILAGSPKIGKSWLSLDLCDAVATGGKLWDFTTTKGDVLDLALEDNYNRLQNRLKQMEIAHINLMLKTPLRFYWAWVAVSVLQINLQRITLHGRCRSWQKTNPLIPYYRTNFF